MRRREVVRTYIEAVATVRLDSTSASESNAPGTRVKYAHTPRLSRVTRPASTSTLRWWETVGWDNPSGSVRSHTQASPPSCAAIMDSSRSLAGSAIAFKIRARSAAAGALSGCRTNGTQHETSTIGSAEGELMNRACPTY